MSERVCVCTSYGAMEEPRAVRHALALASDDRAREVVFLDSLPAGATPVLPPALAALPNVRHLTHFYPHRRGGAIRLAAARVRQSAGRLAYRMTRQVADTALGTRADGLLRILMQVRADVYLGHNIDALLPVYRAARARRAGMMFDCMEYYADMGDGQPAIVRDITRHIEARCLPACLLVLASSPELADRLAADYGIRRPVPLYNAPPLARELPARDEGFALYWRNGTVGLGQRGLGDVLEALTMLPDDVSLHLRGRTPHDGGAALATELRRHGLEARVHLAPAHLPHEAVAVAARHTVGLCLERDTNVNHRTTVSNKLFDYLMAGLGVVVSDLPGLRRVAEQADGMLYESGSPRSLAAAIETLYRDRPRLERMRRAGREFALREGNQERQMQRFVAAYHDALHARRISA